AAPMISGGAIAPPYSVSTCWKPNAKLCPTPSRASSGRFTIVVSDTQGPLAPSDVETVNNLAADKGVWVDSRHRGRPGRRGPGGESVGRSLCELGSADTGRRRDDAPSSGVVPRPGVSTPIPVRAGGQAPGVDEGDHRDAPRLPPAHHRGHGRF